MDPSQVDPQATRPRASSGEGDSAGTLSGRRLGDFRLIRLIGRGGMGSVLEAEQVSLRRRVALKLLDLRQVDGSSAERRFEREAWIAGRLSHAHVVRVLESGVDEEFRWIAMELLGGGTLQDEIDSRVSAPTRESSARRERARRLVKLFVGVADALALVHSQGIVHRDVKPLNLLFSDDRERLLLSDFGLARDPQASQLTQRGDFMGTLRYMSPEQLLAHRARLDHRTDIWSLGVTLYEALTLSHPFDGRSDEQLVSAIASKEPVPARRRAPHLPRDLETILSHCLERDPDRRYQTAADLRDDLVRFLEDRPVLARRPGLAVRAARAARRHRRAIVVALMAAAFTTVLAVAGTVALFRLVQRWRLEAKLHSVLYGAPPVSNDPDWSSLQPVLEKVLKTEPGSDIGRLARLANSGAALSTLRQCGLVSDPPPLLVSIRPRFARGVDKDLSYLAEIEGSWDGGPWHPIAWGANRGDGFEESYPSMDQLKLADVAAPAPLTAAPHVLKTRAAIRVLSSDEADTLRLAPGSRFGHPGGLPLPVANQIPRTSGRWISRYLGDMPITLFDAWPLTYPPARTMPAEPVVRGLSSFPVRVQTATLAGGSGQLEVPPPPGMFGTPAFLDMPPGWPSGAPCIIVLGLRYPGALKLPNLAGDLSLESDDGTVLFCAKLALGANTALALNGRQQPVTMGVAWSDGKRWSAYDQASEVVADAVTPLSQSLVPAPSAIPSRGVLRLVPSREVALAAGLDWYDDQPLSIPVTITSDPAAL